MPDGQAIPQHLNTSDFILVNATSGNVAKLQMSLDYIQAHDPVGTAVLQTMWSNHTAIGLNNFNAIEQFDTLAGTNKWVPEKNLILWNPDYASQIYADDGKTVIGVQSAAEGLVHEASHSLDPSSNQHLTEHMPLYYNTSEWIAVQYETMSANNLGEPTRTNHFGDNIYTVNPTAHTGLGPDGKPVWVQEGPNGTEYGPKYDFTKINKIDTPTATLPGEIPKFGSTYTGAPEPDGHDPGNYYIPDPNGGGGSTSGDGVASQGSGVGDNVSVDWSDGSIQHQPTADWLAPQSGDQFACKPAYDANAYQQFLNSLPDGYVDPSTLGQGNQWDDYGSANTYGYWLGAATGEMTNNLQADSTEAVVAQILQSIGDTAATDGNVYDNRGGAVDSSKVSSPHGMEWHDGGFVGVPNDAPLPIYLVGIDALMYQLPLA